MRAGLRLTHHRLMTGTKMTTQTLDESAVRTHMQSEVHYLGEGHIMSSDCWCCPRLEFKDPETDLEFWVHHQPN